MDPIGSQIRVRRRRPSSARIAGRKSSTRLLRSACSGGHRFRAWIETRPSTSFRRRTQKRYASTTKVTTTRQSALGSTSLQRRCRAYYVGCSSSEVSWLCCEDESVAVFRVVDAFVFPAEVE